MIIREMVEADIDQLIDLYKQLDGANSKLDAEKAKVAFRESLASRIITYLVAELETRLVASCYLVIIPNITNECRPIAFIENVITDERYRGQGIGETLIREAISISKSQNCYKVILQSGMKRTGAHKFYEKLGFDGRSKKSL